MLLTGGPSWLTSRRCSGQCACEVDLYVRYLIAFRRSVDLAVVPLVRGERTGLAAGPG